MIGPTAHRFVVASAALLAVTIATLRPGRADAGSTETQLTPQRTTADGLNFKVTVKDVGETKEVEVTANADATKELSPFLEGRLSAYEGKRLDVSCAVEKRESKGALTFRFCVSSADVHKVQFSFNEYAFAKHVDEKGVVKVVAMPAVDRYWLNLKDFAGGK
jgi:hypothetical protein